MAITVSGSGTSATLSLADWLKAQYSARVGEGGVGHSIDYSTNGFACTPTGTRAVRVDSGDGEVCGLRVNNSAAANTASLSNTSTNPRIDIIALKVDPSLDASSAGTIVVLQGTPAANPSAPTNLVTQTPGGVWHVPLARASLAGGGTSTVTIEDCRPKPRIPYVYNLALNLQTIPSPGTAELSQFVQPATVADPGWPYRLRVAARVNANPSSTGVGFTVCTVYLNSSAVADGRSDKGGNIPASALVKTTAIVSGQSSLVVVTLKTSAWPSEACTPVSNFTDCNVTVIPA